MTFYSFLLNCFTHPTYERNLYCCENGKHTEPDIKIDFWELLILLQRIIIILYKILKKFKILKMIKALV